MQEPGGPRDAPEHSGADSVPELTPGPGSPQGGVPYRGGDVLLVIGVGLFLILGLFMIVGSVLYAVEADFSLGVFAVTQAAAYALQAWLAWYVIMRRRRAAPEQIGLKWVGSGPLLLMVPVMLLVVFATAIAGYVQLLVFRDVVTAQEQLLGSGDAFPLRDFIPLFIVVVVLAPLVEEFVYRGVFFRYLRSRRSFWFAASISSLVFAISHFIPTLILSLFVLGLFLAYVTEHYKSIYPAVVLHGLNNLYAITVVYLALN